MNITINVAKFTEIVDIATRFVSKHATLPILENLHLKASIDTLTIKATDMEKHVDVSMGAEIINDGSITINAKTLNNIIKTIDDEKIQIIVDQNNSTLTIKSTTDTFNIKGIPATEYVALPEVSKDNTLKVDATALITGIEKVEYTVSEKNFSPVLTGIYMRTQKEGNQTYLIFAGSDSFRLAEYKVPIDEVAQDLKVIIPKININDIKRVCEYCREQDSDEITVQYSENLIAFSSKLNQNYDITTTSLLIQGNFPDYNNENIMPTSFNTTIVADKDNLEKSIRKIMILTKDINNYLMIQTGDNAIEINSGDTDRGAAKTSIPTIITGNSVEVGVNGKYINDMIKISWSNDILINIVDAQKPLVLKDPDDNNYTYIVRPLLK